MPPREPSTAQPLIFGKYELVQRLGAGGMAEVWRARIQGPAGFSRSLVIKRILPHLATDAAFVKMFISEAQLSAKLSHPNVIQVFELGQVDGEYYIAMEYVRGRDLTSLTRDHLERRGALPTAVSAYVMREVCRALGYAHEFRDEDGHLVRLIHRDVSPSNVMISNDGAIKLLDFGIAKAMAESGDRTQTGTLKGKFAYMAPEQLEGNDFDHRADIFAAGTILHEILSGRRLFRGKNDLQTISLVKTAQVVPPSQLNPEVTPALDAIVLKALARDPAARYQSATELANDLDDVVHGLKGGPQRVTKLIAELYAGERGPRPGLQLSPTTPVSAPHVVAPAPAGESVPTSVEIKASFTNAPRAAAPAVDPLGATQGAGATTAPTLPAYNPPDVARASLWELTSSALNLKPPMRRVALIGIVALAGIVAAVIAMSLPHGASEPIDSPAASAPATTTNATTPATAPVVTPPTAAAATEPAKPETVAISINSQPSGAEVFLDSEPTARGRTPIVLTLPRARRLRVVKLLARGYVTSTSTFSTSSDVQLGLSLVRQPPPPRRVIVTRPAPPPKLPATAPTTDDAHSLSDPFGPKHR